MSGFFVTLEGGEAAGKSTQVAMLTDALAAAGRSVLRTREPGGAPGAEALRGFLLARDHGLDLKAEVLVHFAARFDHLERTIRPALAAGRVVICDRFCDSTIAYQGYGLGHGAQDVLAFITRMIELAALEPDLTLLLDLPRREARARLATRGMRADRYESLDEPFHQRVLDGFQQIARGAPGRIVRVDAQGGVDQLHRALLFEVEKRLAR